MLKKIVVLGCGNMAQAILKGYKKKAKNGLFSFSLFDPIRDKAQKLAQQIDGKVVESFDEIPDHDYILFAFKPQQFNGVLEKIEKSISSKTIVLSILAGIPTRKINICERVVRVMPNTPCLVGEGMAALYFSGTFAIEEKTEISSLFNATSKVIELDEEEKIDIVTGVNGSGPAYFFQIAQYMMDYLIKNNFTEDQAKEFSAQTIKGAAQLMLDSQELPNILRDRVTSKGGVTQEALKVFEDNNLDIIVDKALKAAFSRAKELAQ